MAARRAGSSAPRWLPPSVLLLLTVLFSASPPARALRFDLESGHTKCISDEIKVGSMAVGKYHVVGPDPNSPDSQLPDSHRISLKVTSPYGNSMHYAENVQTGHFGFTAAEAGDYLACFWAPDHKPPVSIVFEFDWRNGLTAKDWPSVAKKGQVDMNPQHLVKETQAQDVDGYPALLRDMMWRANFTYQPMYYIYRQDQGPGMEQYRAVVRIITRRVTGSIPYQFEGHGTSESMALQEAARMAMSRIRYDLTELSQPPYDHFPIRAYGSEVDTFAQIQFGEDPQVRQLARLVHILDQVHRCTLCELWETRRRLIATQEILQNLHNRGITRRNLIPATSAISPSASAPPEYRLPEVEHHNINEWAPLRLTSLQDPEDTGSPGYHLLDEFPVNFDRDNV